MWTPEIFGYGVGAALIVVAIIGGGLELSGTKVPRIGGKARYALAALGMAFLVASFLLLRENRAAAPPASVVSNEQTPADPAGGNVLAADERPPGGPASTHDQPSTQEPTRNTTGEVGGRSANEIIVPVQPDPVVIPRPPPIEVSPAHRVRLVSAEPTIPVYRGPGIRFAEIGRVPRNTIVTARRRGQWWRIEGSQERFVFNGYVDENIGD